MITYNYTAPEVLRGDFFPPCVHKLFSYVHMIIFLHTRHRIKRMAWEGSISTEMSTLKLDTRENYLMCTNITFWNFRSSVYNTYLHTYTHNKRFIFVSNGLRWVIYSFYFPSLTDYCHLAVERKWKQLFKFLLRQRGYAEKKNVFW